MTLLYLPDMVQVDIEETSSKNLGREMILRVADICKKIKNVRVFSYR